MLLGVSFANGGRGAAREYALESARIIDRLGFESICAGGHYVIPRNHQSWYPHTANGRNTNSPDTPNPDPLTWLATASAVTENVRLGTDIALVPVFSLAVLAKIAATIDMLSGGRFVLGVGVWREHESAINSLPNYQVVLDGVPVHFGHVRGVGPDPQPLILSHGWPWMFWDYRKVLGPLTDPAAHGGDPADAFDVVIPSLPGFGFSVPIEQHVCWIETADLWARLMHEVLAHDHFFAAGGDWGNPIATQLGHK
jgi:hypothetical protein